MNKLFKKINEEKYFKDFRELHKFVAKSSRITSEQLTDHAEKYKSVLHEKIMPMNDGGLIVVGRFLCVLTIGRFNRRSAVYKYNLLSIQRTATLTGNHLKQIFKY